MPKIPRSETELELERIKSKCYGPCTAEDCWVWQGEINPKGYGIIYRKGKKFKAHRWMWITHQGEIPEGMCVLHRCDNRPCVNPDHLFLGTAMVNAQDMVTKNRQAAKLTPQQIDEIRLRHRPKCQFNGTRALAKEFQVSGATIEEIVSRRGWKHLPEPENVLVELGVRIHRKDLDYLRHKLGRLNLTHLEFIE